MLCDLHTHAAASDGQYTPTELVELAKARGLSVLVVTDYDTIAGVAEAQRAGNALGLTVIRGVELSAKDYPTATSWGTAFGTGTRSWPVCASSSGRAGTSGSIKSWIFSGKRAWSWILPRWRRSRAAR